MRAFSVLPLALDKAMPMAGKCRTLNGPTEYSSSSSVAARLGISMPLTISGVFHGLHNSMITITNKISLFVNTQVREKFVIS